MAKFPRWLSRGTQLLLSSQGQYLPSVFPTAKSLCGAQGRIRTGHTCIPYIVNSKRGPMEKQVMQSRSKGASVWVDGWMDVAYSLRQWFSLSNHPCLSLSLFLRHGYPFFSLFWVKLLWHAIFALFGATIIWLYFISGMFYERDHQDLEHLLMEDEWMVVLNSWCRNVANGWDVYVLMIEKAWKASH